MSQAAQPPSSPRSPQGRPRPDLSDERLQALAADMIQAFARIARRRF